MTTFPGFAPAVLIPVANDPRFAIDCSDDSPPPVVFESAGDGEPDLHWL